MEYKPKQKKTTLEKRERFTNRLPYPIFIFGNPNSFYSHDTDRKKYTYTNLKWKQKNIYKNLHENDSRIKTECLNFAKNTYILLIKSMQKELNKTMKNGSRNNNTNKKKQFFFTVYSYLLNYTHRTYYYSWNGVFIPKIPPSQQIRTLKKYVLVYKKMMLATPIILIIILLIYMKCILGVF